MKNVTIISKHLIDRLIPDNPKLKKSGWYIVCLVPFFFLNTFSIHCQTLFDTTSFNLDLEECFELTKWKYSGSPDYTVALDSTTKVKGKYSLLIENGGDSLSYKIIGLTFPGTYEGKIITLSGFIKTENITDGYGGLWMRIDPRIAFDNMQDRGVIGTTEWKKFEIKIGLEPSRTKQIVVGALLTGKGKLWVDGLNVSIDGRDILGLKSLPASEFVDGSKIDSIVLTENTIDALDILGKVWGFLKYHHPSVTKGNYNWDHELFKIIPKVLETNNQIGRNHVIAEWVNALGPLEINVPENIEGEIIIYPDVSWIDSTTLGKNLATQLIDIKNALRGEESYYITLQPENDNPEFNNEESYKNFPYPDAGIRLLSLFRYWNMIQYYFPYKNLIQEYWNNVLKEFIPQFVNASSELEYKTAALLLIARIHDTHANIWGNDFTLLKHYGLNYAPVEISFVENKAVVTGYYNEELGKKSGLIVGDIIEKINNKSISQIVHEKIPFTPASNYPTQLRDIAKNLLRTNDSILTVEYIQDDKVITKQIECYPFWDKLNLNFKYTKQDTCLKIINDDIAYLNPGYLSKQGLQYIIPEILKSRGLIIDLRKYPTAFLVFTLTEYLLPEEKSFAKLSAGSIRSPGLFKITKLKRVGKQNANFYRGKVVIIVNEETQSSGEYHAMAFQTAPKAIIIGSQTAGADGNVSRFFLPGGIWTWFSGIGVYYPDGRNTQRIGIVPDIEVKPSIKSLKEGRDSLLEKAIEIINSD